MGKFLIVGLGNPGRKYRGNRHNIGFMAVDALAAAHGIEGKTVQNKAIVASGRVGSEQLIVAKPQTFMNSSGDSVGPLANYYRIPNENVLVIYDELELPIGTIRLPDWRRAAERCFAYVLRDIDKGEQPEVADILQTAVSAVETYLKEGIQLAMSRHNGTILDKN